MRYFFIHVFMCLVLSIQGQNLVSNGSFEETCSSEPGAQGYFGATGWYNCNLGTFDIFTQGDPEPACFVLNTGDLNWEEFGEYQSPAEGSNMVGCYSFMPQFCLRELIQSRLASPLEEGKQYCFSMKVALSNMSNSACNGLGAAFTVDSITDFSTTCLPAFSFTTALQGDPVTDTLNWTTLSTTFIALGGEEFITIGNVHTDAEIEVVSVEGSTGLESAYYFIDDVVLEMCTGSSVHDRQKEELVVYPNPSNGQINLVGVESKEIWQVFSITGAIIQEGFGNQVDVRQLVPGNYLIRLGDRVSPFEVY